MAKINLKYTTDILMALLNTPSPTGDTDTAITMVESAFAALGIPTQRTGKGALVATMLGKNTDSARALSGHVDTLGGMVKEIKENGRLKLTNLGGYYPGSIVGEYCTIHTADGKKFSGTVVLSKQSVHIHRADAIHDTAKDLGALEVRLDLRSQSETETRAFGIQIGDCVSWDARATLTESGFIKSRHLDDKAGVAAMLGATEALVSVKAQPTHTTHFYISTYEEVGHGAASGIPADTAELLVVDMGVVGDGQAGDEYSVSICVKDGSGPYDLRLRQHLVKLAGKANIPFKLDVFVNYGSDGSAALRGGLDARVGLIGPGVESSHAYERTHQDALKATTKLIVEYLLS